MVYANHQPLKERLERERSALKKHVRIRATPGGEREWVYLGQLLVQLGVYQRQILVHVRVQHQRKHGRHRIDRRIPNHEPPLVERDRRKVKDGREHGLHHRDDQAAVDDELGEFGGAAVRVAAVPHEEFGEVAELGDGEVGGEGGLFAFFAHDSDT